MDYHSRTLILLDVTPWLVVGSGKIVTSRRFMMEVTPWTLWMLFVNIKFMFFKEMTHLISFLTTKQRKTVDICDIQNNLSAINQVGADPRQELARTFLSAFREAILPSFLISFWLFLADFQFSSASYFSRSGYVTNVNNFPPILAWRLALSSAQTFATCFIQFIELKTSRVRNRN